MTLAPDHVAWLVTLFLLSLRFSGLLFVAQPFAGSSFPAPVKYWMALLLALFALAPDVPVPLPECLGSVPGLLVAMLSEFLAGALLGFLAGAPLYALQITGRFAGMQMGFGMANILDPFSESQIVVVEQLYLMTGMWFFFSWNGHLLFAKAAAESLKILPLGICTLKPAGELGLGVWLQKLLVISMQLALPFFGALLLADVGLGFVARTVPQMNVFILGIPIKILLGFFLMVVVLPMTIEMVRGEVEHFVRFALESLGNWR